jgi:hypothetical protein
MEQKINKFVYWAPRILSIMFILFLMLFSLDIFDMELDFWGTALGLFMHNIPALFLLVILIISWKYEIVGGIVFTLAGTLYIARLLMTILRTPPPQWFMLFWSLPIAGPALLVGILFLVCWFKKKKITPAI